MKRLYSTLPLVMVLAFCFPLFSIIAFAEDTVSADDVSRILESYYASPEIRASNSSSNISVQDPYAVVEKGSTIHSNKLIQTFSTNTNTKGELLELCQRVKNGERLADLVTSDGAYYTITTDAAGKATGYAIINADSFSVQEFGELNEYTRKDLQLTKATQSSIAKSKLDLAATKALFCTIHNFSTGHLIYDDDMEYFVPSVESMESMGLLRVGEMYLVSDLATIIENNMNTIFPENEVDEQGNPHTGAGTAIQPQQVELDSVNRLPYLKYVSIVCMIGAIVCFAIVIKLKRKRPYNLD